VLGLIAILSAPPHLASSHPNPYPHASPFLLSNLPLRQYKFPLFSSIHPAHAAIRMPRMEKFIFRRVCLASPTRTMDSFLGLSAMLVSKLTVEWGLEGSALERRRVGCLCWRPITKQPGGFPENDRHTSSASFCFCISYSGSP